MAWGHRGHVAGEDQRGILTVECGNGEAEAGGHAFLPVWVDQNLGVGQGASLLDAGGVGSQNDDDGRAASLASGANGSVE